MGEHLTTEGKSSGIATVDHGTRHNRGARTQIGQPIEVYVVQNAGAIQLQGDVYHLLQLLGFPMLGAKTQGKGKHLLALSQRHQHLDPCQVSSTAHASVFLNPFPGTHRLAFLRRLAFI
jgi:hypothetical protein